jgi:hypothetical protein
MLDVSSCRYRAFLSYSEADKHVATRVYRHLQAFRVEKGLVGGHGALGPIPKTLCPIFRRLPLGLDAVFGKEIRKVLDDSAAIVVLASHSAARSKRVNEEVRWFKAHHPDRPVIPLIIDGEPGDFNRECFPPALQAETARYAGLMDATVAMVGVDMRKGGEQFQLALVKIAAHLLGLPPSSLIHRFQHKRQLQNRRLTVAGASISVAAAIAGVFVWRSHLDAAMIEQIAVQVETNGAASSYFRRDFDCGSPPDRNRYWDLVHRSPSSSLSPCTRADRGSGATRDKVRRDKEPPA